MKYEIIISDRCSLYLFADDFIINEDNNTLEFFAHRCLAKDRIAYFNLNNIVGFYEMQEDILKRMFEDEQKLNLKFMKMKRWFKKSTLKMWDGRVYYCKNCRRVVKLNDISCRRCGRKFKPIFPIHDEEYLKIIYKGWKQ